MQANLQLLALLCGHFLGYLVFQTEHFVELGAKSVKWKLYNALQISIVTWLLLGNLSAWWIVVVLLLVNIVVDWITSCISKSKTSTQRNEKTSIDLIVFASNQLLHILFIIVIWFILDMLSTTYTFPNYWESLLGAKYTKGLILLAGLSVGISGMSRVLKYQMADFAVKLDTSVRQGLPKGGETIGILERILVFMFVLAGNPEGVGFVLAAKSVFRIGELTN